jgi:hypothetical protein
VLEIIAALRLLELVEESATEVPEFVDSAFSPVAKELLELGECQLDGIEIG